MPMMLKGLNRSLVTSAPTFQRRVNRKSQIDMNSKSFYPSRWTIVVIYAIAMAWVEAAVVYYLRTMIHRLDPYQPNPLPVIGYLGPVEAIREAATLVMLLTVG